mmetsp:Transcript_59845/g.131325  ORF Transcript_59845/g.131325 Transcript_59845/m.131325 type:complete len:275 (+) Transcript_59845:126-950(+)
MQRNGGGIGIEQLQCGLIAGLVVTGVLNPWDRALYLSIIRCTPFLARENWRTPYQGVLQTLVQRSVSSGLYFPLEEKCSRALGSHALGGQLAGIVNALLLNPIALVKHQSWGSEHYNVSFARTALRLYRDAGPLVFFRGAIGASMRDGTFGLCFSMRHVWRQPDDGVATSFAISLLCAAVGTTLSSPFNYVRNLAYAAESSASMESPRAKMDFWRCSMEELFGQAAKQASPLASMRHLQDRLRIGWGTTRVAVGMALTDQIYKICSRFLMPKPP